MHYYDTISYAEKQAEKYEFQKQANLILADVLDTLGERSAVDVRLCLTKAVMRWCGECNRMHVAGMMCCRHRLCPICQVKRSRRIAEQALEAIELLRITGQLEGTSMHLLTLTQKNVESGKLADEINALLEALKRIRHTADARNYVVGMARNIEITRNYEMHTWHPHVHIIVILRDGRPDMTTADYWRVLWRRVMNLNYNPEVDIRPIVDDGAVYEVSKYVAKSTELLTNMQNPELTDAIGELNTAIRERTLVVYTGIWRKARRELKQMDSEEVDDLIDTESGDVCDKCGGPLYHAMMIWDGNRYVVKSMDETYVGGGVTP